MLAFYSSVLLRSVYTTRFVNDPFFTIESFHRPGRKLISIIRYYNLDLLTELSLGHGNEAFKQSSFSSNTTKLPD